MSSLRGDTEEVNNLLEEVRGFYSPYLNSLQPVATIAAMREHAGVLNLAFAKGAHLDRKLCLAMDKGKDWNGPTKDIYQQHEVTIKEELNRKIPTMLKGGIPASTFDPGDTLHDTNW